MTEKQKRVSSVKLDATLVRMHAAAMKIYAVKAFESKFDLQYGNEPFSQVSNAPGNAWSGKKMAFKQAQNVAIFLGLKHYSELELNNAHSKWSTLLGEDYTGNKMFDLQLEEVEDDEEDEFRNVNFNQLYKRNLDEMDVVDIDRNWHLLLWGEPGDDFAVFLQSNRCFCQIVPIDHESCQSQIAAKTQAIAIPPQPVLKFDQEEGLGWRRFIVIRAKHLPLPPKSEATGHLVSGQELERFATLLLQEQDLKVAVDTYEFVLK